MRLDKLLAHSGFGTRKEVKNMIKKGHVSINNQVIKIDKYQVDTCKDIVEVDGEIIEYEEYVYYMLNKPAGYVSATEDMYYPTVVDLITDYYRHDLFPIGRLDIDTEGLLILSNDGVLAHQLLSPKKHCPKVYYAKIEGVVDENDIIQFRKGIVLEDITCQSAELHILAVEDGYSEIELTIYEGKFHQVKRMFLAVGKKVIYLQRKCMKDLKLDSQLALGEYRKLTQEELDRLKN